MKILFALAGLHRVDRGAEIAFTSIAEQLARSGDDVTLIGTGPERSEAAYQYIGVPAIDRGRFERLPSLPLFRDETAWEDASFLPGLMKAYRPKDYDVTLTCAFPFTNWALRRPVLGRPRPAHVFVTQNGDWPACSDTMEYRFFGCDGLVCINPDYYERNSQRYRCALIPNGVDLARFSPGEQERERFGLPRDASVVLMVSALIPSKNVAEGIEAVSRVPGAFLLVAGDGPLRSELRDFAEKLLPSRYGQLTVSPSQMPALYRSADVFLHLSRNESFGNVFIEALATGLPVVAYDLPRTRWILGSVGDLAESENLRSVGEQIAKALAAPRQGRKQRIERAAEFGWPRIAAQYRNFLREIAQDHGSGATRELGRR